MSLVAAALTAIIRLFRPSRGLHARPFVLRDEAALVRPAVAARPAVAVPARVRPYAAHVAPADEGTVPAEDGPDEAPADDGSPVRPYVLVWERTRAAALADRADVSRLGTAVLIDLAARAEVTA